MLIHLLCAMKTHLHFALFQMHHKQFITYPKVEFAIGDGPKGSLEWLALNYKKNKTLVYSFHFYSYPKTLSPPLQDY